MPGANEKKKKWGKKKIMKAWDKLEKRGWM